MRIRYTAKESAIINVTGRTKLGKVVEEGFFKDQFSWKYLSLSYECIHISAGSISYLDKKVFLVAFDKN
jgi:hypothetical protein